MLRLIERIGLTILLACAIALLVAGILLWHGRPAQSIVEILLAVAIVVGAVWGGVSRPTLFQAALEIDRQTDSAELFSSALLAGQTSDFPGNAWAGAVVASAEDHCQAASMAAVNLRRYGGREWGGILLAVALVLTLALLGPAPVQSLDLDTTIANKSKSTNEDATNLQKVKFIGSSDNRPIVLSDPDDLSPNSLGNSQTTPADPSQGKPGDANPSDAQASAAASSNGTGGNMAHTHSSSNSANSQLTDHASGAGKPASDKATAIAGGTGSSSSLGKTTGESPNSAMLTAGNAHQPTQLPAPWKSANWPAQIEEARKAVDGGRVPAAYRDLVRDYFSLESISTAVPD